MGARPAEDRAGAAKPAGPAEAVAVRRFEGHTDGVLVLAFSPDGKYALSGSLDKSIRLWKLPR